MTAFSNSGLTEMTNLPVRVLSDLAPSTLLMCRNDSYIVDNKSLLNIKMESLEMSSSQIVCIVLSHFVLCLLDHVLCTAACRHHSPCNPVGSCGF